MSAYIMTINLKENNDLIIKIEKSTQVSNRENNQIVIYDFRLYTNKPINHENVEFISYNGVDFEEENIPKVEKVSPYAYDEGIEDINEYKQIEEHKILTPLMNRNVFRVSNVFFIIINLFNFE